MTAVMASALGGYVTGRLRVRWTRAPLDEVYFRDTAHGVLAWAFATVMGAALLASAATVVGSGAANPGFDVTPARLVTGFITERGTCAATPEGLRSLFPETQE